jgi:hypothetical protein
VTALARPEAIVQANYRSNLSPERVPTSRNPQLSDRKEKSGHEFQMGAWHQDTLAIGPTSTSTNSLCSSVNSGDVAERLTALNLQKHLLKMV